MADVVVLVKQGHYCGWVPQSDWSGGLTRSVADEIRRWRTVRKLSAQQVADRCADAGLQISRSTLADLENGRRPLVSIAEILVLAAVLDVAPALLVAPLGQKSKTEILPGIEMPTRDAVLWIAGEMQLPGDLGARWLDWTDDQGIVPLYHRHEQLVADWAAIGPNEQVSDKDGKVIMSNADLKRETVQELGRVRSAMRSRGLILPPLPEDLAHVDDQRPGPSRRK